MNILQLRIVSAGLFLLLIVPSGLWLGHAGKPYSAMLFNLHKLIALGAFIFLMIHVYRMHQVNPLTPLQFTVCVLTALFFVSTIVSGGLVSVDRSIPAAVLMSHKLLPYLTLLSTTASLYLLGT